MRPDSRVLYLRNIRSLKISVCSLTYTSTGWEDLPNTVVVVAVEFSLSTLVALSSLQKICTNKASNDLLQSRSTKPAMRTWRKLYDETLAGN
jgi:hypothetical protein